MTPKHSLNITGSDTLLKAFAEELEELGYIKNNESSKPLKSVITYLSGKYNVFDNTNDNYGEFPKMAHLPEDWNQALKLAAEKENEELEVGKWYIGVREFFGKSILCCCQKGNKGYGFYNGSWVDNSDFSPEYFADPDYNYTLREATKEEIQQALIAEAEKRGFKKGIMFNSVKGTPFAWEDDNTKVTGSITFKEERCALVTGCGVIFYNGKWAEIVEDKLTVAGYDVEDKEVGIKIGCQLYSELDLMGVRNFLLNTEPHGQIEIIYEGKRIKEDLKKIFDKYL